MCTVTFIPSGNKFFFTSSRDEQAGRPVAVFPKLYEINGHQVLFPKDPPSGGSWIAVNESGSVAVLMNGAIKGHQPQPPYRKSRGLVLTDLIANTSLADIFEETDFKGIEPFTIILFEDKNLYSGKWDGKMKWLESLNSNRPHIWSSVTLYDQAAIRKRELWFNKWLAENTYPGTLDIIHFHQKGGDGDPFNDILMNRESHLFTNSISSIRLSTDNASFRYLDLRSGETAEIVLPIQKTIPVKV
jgi:hypothetical protein